MSSIPLLYGTEELKLMPWRWNDWAVRLNNKSLYRRRVFLVVIGSIATAAILYWLIGVVVLPQFSSGDQVVFESELWPGMGVPQIAAKKTHLRLHHKPSLKPRLVQTLRVEKGNLIDFDDSRHRTISPGVITVTQKGTLRARDLGRIAYLKWSHYYNGDMIYKNLEYDIGDSFHFLQYTSELSCLISWHERAWEPVICPWIISGSISDFTMVSVPQTEWWVRVINRKQKALGWLLVDEKVELLKKTRF
jgi:hypothetical protein